MRGHQTAPGNAMSRHAGTARRPDSNRRQRPVRTRGHMALVSAWLASAWALLGAAVLVSDAALMRRRVLARPDDPAGSSAEVAG